MQTKRKGARWLDIGTERWSYYVGKRFIEIISPTGVKTLVPRETLDQEIKYVIDCDVCGPGCDYDIEGRTHTGTATLPGKVISYVRENLRH